MARTFRPLTALALLTTLALPACGGARVESLEHDRVRLRGEAERAHAAESAQRSLATRLAAELETARTAADTRAKELESLRVEVAKTREGLTRLQALAAQSAEAAASAKGARESLRVAEKSLEKEKKERGKIESHRDELVDWVKELLPLAEKQDARLAGLRDATEEMARQVESFRGLTYKRPFMRRLIARDDVSKFLMRDMQRELPPEEAATMTRVMAEFGMVQKGTDLHEIFLGFLEAGAAAFYKPDTETFYLIEGKNDAGDRPIIFHELVHALEDQYFGLDLMQEAFEENADGGMGVKALVEGSAEHFTNLYGAAHPEDVKAMMAAQMTPEMMRRQFKMMQDVPTFLIASMGLYPYKNGAAWLGKIGATDGESVNRLFASPPISTEQVLHPERSGDFPQTVAAPDIGAVLGPEWEILDDDVMGELFTGLLMTALRWGSTGMQGMLAVMDMQTQGIGFKAPYRGAAEGWDGDRYVAAIDRKSDRVVIVWTTVWDSADDATEFADVYGALLGKRVTGQQVDTAVLPMRFRAGDGAVSGIDVDGRRAVVVLSAPADRAEALFEVGGAAEITPDERDPNDR